MDGLSMAEDRASILDAQQELVAVHRLRTESTDVTSLSTGAWLINGRFHASWHDSLHQHAPYGYVCADTRCCRHVLLALQQSQKSRDG